jgi:glyoxylase-like metal-dependent hydrolase (beta-lactamase superfamily II)
LFSAFLRESKKQQNLSVLSVWFIVVNIFYINGIRVYWARNKHNNQYNTINNCMPVHLISGGYANTYLIEDGNSFVAVDVGTSKAAKKIYYYLSYKSIDASSLRMVTTTHFHIDHIGGISRPVQFFLK